MRFRFSLKTTLICGVLSLAMIRASIWQWHRHLEKQALIHEMGERLRQPAVPLETLLQEKRALSEYYFRKVIIEGNYDFSHEMLLRNRRYDGIPGVLLLTPATIPQSTNALIVSRGFIPNEYKTSETRKQFQHPQSQRFIGLIKESVPQRFLAPADPPSGAGYPWVDEWLRVNIPEIKKQLPYPLFPFYVEVMGDEQSLQEIEKKIFASHSDRDEMLTLATRELNLKPDLSKYTFPALMYDTIIPPGRHLGYVYEWALMAVITLIIGIILQLRRDSRMPTSSSSTS